jgi:hypothetical protein
MKVDLVTNGKEKALRMVKQSKGTKYTPQKLPRFNWKGVCSVTLHCSHRTSKGYFLIYSTKVKQFTQFFKALTFFTYLDFNDATSYILVEVSHPHVKFVILALYCIKSYQLAEVVYLRPQGVIVRVVDIEVADVFS